MEQEHNEANDDPTHKQTVGVIGMTVRKMVKLLGEPRHVTMGR